MPSTRTVLLVVAHSRKQNHATVAVMVTPPIIALVLKVLT